MVLKDQECPLGNECCKASVLHVCFVYFLHQTEPFSKGHQATLTVAITWARNMELNPSLRQTLTQHSFSIRPELSQRQTIMEPSCWIRAQHTCLNNGCLEESGHSPEQTLGPKKGLCSDIILDFNILLIIRWTICNLDKKTWLCSQMFHFFY